MRPATNGLRLGWMRGRPRWRDVRYIYGAAISHDEEWIALNRKKLIEVALPLEAINEEGSQRKRKAPKGFPTTLHNWWAQRPVAAARAVVFAQMVDDPSTYVSTLLRDPELERRAKRELRERQALWQRRHDAWTEAQTIGGKSSQDGA